jgi:Sec-independent protein secretion pathway component TatC
MLTSRQIVTSLVLGIVLAIICAYVGSLLTPPAIVRWTFQIQEEENLRAAFAMLGVRHLPMFLIAVALGNPIFTWLKRSSLVAVLVVAVPYIAYVIGAGIADSLAAGESAFSWVTYDPAYFIWPHFVAVPGGLLAASRMVDRRTRRAVPP